MYEIILIPLAAFMVYFVAIVIKWAFRARERLGFSLVLFLLSMMSSMLAGVAIYFTSPSLQSLEIAAGLSFTVMTAGLIAVFYSFITYGSGNRQPTTAPASTGLSMFRASAILLALLNELLMGWSFSLISGVSKAALLHASSFIQVVDLSVNSYWFTLTMGAEMFLTVLYMRKHIPRGMMYVLLMQGGIMILAPPALVDLSLSAFAVYAGSALMVILFIHIFDLLYRNRTSDTYTYNYLLRLMAIYSFMMAGLMYWGLRGSGIFFGITLMAEMILFFDAVLRAKDTRVRCPDWHSRPWWTFGLLVFLFAAEFFMAGIIDLVYYGPSFIQGVQPAPMTGSLTALVAGSLFNFISYVSLVTGSAWFYVMMGVEMGALVLFQIGKVKQLETKVRLALVIVAYAVYTVFLPYFFYSGAELPHVAFIGWNMGVGTSGAFAPAFLVAIAGTYLISGTLSFLFGGRQVCSMFCAASLMYQGTFYDSSKSFNRKSRLARATHRNSLGKTFGVVASLVWASIFAAVLISYLDSVGVVDLTVFGVDPVVFAYLFYFNFLWYVIFITIPFVGNYACVTTGACHWGMFNQLVGRIGLFRLRVKDRYECVNCKTKDCAKACPVGLTALPGKFIELGEFRNYKCIGVGQCASACPVDNIFFYDARHWFRERVSGRKSLAPPIQGAAHEGGAKK